MVKNIFRLTLIMFIFLFNGCEKKEVNVLKKEDTKQSEVEEKEVSDLDLTTKLLSSEDWKQYFSCFKETKDVGNLLRKGNSLTKPIMEAAEEFNYIWRGGWSIRDHSGMTSILGMNIFVSQDEILILLKKVQGRQGRSAIYSVEDVVLIPNDMKNLEILRSKTEEMSNYSKERNIWGMIDWDWNSPLIKHNTWIPAEKVIIIDVDNCKIIIDENEDGKYKIFIETVV